MLNVIEDLDGDGVEDPYDPDDDQDGFSDAEEEAYGSDPRDPTSVANQAPVDIDLATSFILENQPVGTVVGVLSAVDPDDENGTGSYHFEFVDGNGTSNDQFALDANGTLRTAAVFDFEAFDGNPTLTIRVGVRDEHNASFVRSGEIEVLNVIEDLDGDGVEDHYDPDDDDDGYSDAEELEAGTRPDSNASIPTAALVVEATTGGDAHGSGVFPRGEEVPISAVAHEGFVFSHWEGGGVFEHNASDTLASMIEDHFLTAVFHRQAYPVIVEILAGQGLVEGAGEYLFEDNATLVAMPADGYSFAGWQMHGPEGQVGLLFENPLVFPIYGPLSLELTFSLDNRPPDGLELVGDQVTEEADPDTLIGRFMVTDPDDPEGLDDYNFTLVGEHAELFEIEFDGSLLTARPIDYEESGSILRIVVVAADQDEAFIEQEFEIRVTNAFVPIVRTLPASEPTSDGVLLGGQLLADGMGQVTGLGVELSRHQFFQTTDPSTRRFSADDYNGSFEIHVHELEPEAQYFYRAYAENAEGISYGAKKRFTTPVPEARDLWAEARAVGYGWLELPWFGYFQAFDSDWIYHGKLGWLFAQEEANGEGFWLWFQHMGWLWTSEESFPYLYRDSTQSWLYFLDREEGSAAFYDFRFAFWFTADHLGVEDGAQTDEAPEEDETPAEEIDDATAP